jgi:shikimate dehydrogenase
MRKFGLIGYPLGHSFSRTYFSEKFKSENIADSSYENYPIPEISEFIRLIGDTPELCGLNVTIPYKTEVMRYLDITDSEAVEIGAVNVIKINRTDNRIKLLGFNSDVTGIRDSILPYKSQIKNAMVLGTGGSAKGVCFVLRKYGINVTNVTRTRRSGFIDYSEITPGLLKRTDLIVNTTPLGMFPDTEQCPDLDYSQLSGKHILFDLVYNPERTLFLRKGERMGCIIVGGLKMLHSQAERSWQIWNDPELK